MIHWWFRPVLGKMTPFTVATVGLCLTIGPIMAFVVDDLLAMLFATTVIGGMIGLVNLGMHEVYSRHARRKDDNGS